MTDFILATDEDDFLHIESLANNIWREHYKTILSAEQIDYMLKRFQSKQAIKDAVSEGYLYYIIVSDGDKAGYFAVINQSDGLFMSKLYIKKEFRGRGLGRQTMNKIKSIAQNSGAKKVYLSANKNNATSIEIYKKLGFSIVKSTCTDIGGGFVMDDFVLECSLTKQAVN